MKLLTTITFLLLSTVIIAQVALSGRYTTFNNDILKNTLFFEDSKINSSAEIGVGYWFRLKKKRLEFIPELTYTFHSYQESGVEGTLSGASSFSANFNALIYPLDFHSDCDVCPTFSKEGGLIKKGFYWLISPSITSSRFKAIKHNIDPEPSLEFTTWRLGGGAGLDIGITNLLTFSPFAVYYIGGTIDTDGTLTSSNIRHNQVHAGLRAILRFDKDKW